jgi:hypothetical protein
MEHGAERKWKLEEVDHSLQTKRQLIGKGTSRGQI